MYCYLFLNVCLETWTRKMPYISCYIKTDSKRSQFSPPATSAKAETKIRVHLRNMNVLLHCAFSSVNASACVVLCSLPVDLLCVIGRAFGMLPLPGPLAGSRYPKSKITNISRTSVPAPAPSCARRLLQQNSRDERQPRAYTPWEWCWVYFSAMMVCSLIQCMRVIEFNTRLPFFLHMRIWYCGVTHESTRGCTWRRVF